LPAVADRDTVARLRRAAQAALDVVAQAPSSRLARTTLAERVDLEAVPAALRRRVAELLDGAEPAEPLPFADVERILRDAWGARPSKVLADLDREPAAVRPASQVHRGEDADGNAVAVKVLRPGLAAAVRADLALADAVAAIAGGVVPRLDPAALAAEVRERLLDELDLEYEASVQRSFHRALRRHPELGVPGVDGALASESVLVSRWVQGIALTDLEGEERGRAARLYLRFHLGAAVHGTVHADPDPRDALLDRDGRLWVVDFGASRRVAPERLALASAALDALAAGDARRLGALLEELGWLPAEEAHEALVLAREVAGPLLGGEAVLDAAALRAAGERALDRAGQLAALAVRGGVAPEDLWPLRTAGQLVGALATLGARDDWIGLARAALRDGW
jgi:predicted unusual protein kinase regulating ubiquinone biosynthesis (AarF/ABC1/UbiB family)